jgi:hypothetical protein
MVSVVVGGTDSQDGGLTSYPEDGVIEILRNSWSFYVHIRMKGDEGVVGKVFTLMTLCT